MCAKTLVILLLINLSLVVTVPTKRESQARPATCQACYPIDVEKINVHLVPHSHDDVGWLKTVDQYYYGTEKRIQYAGVQYIISSSIQALIGHPHRRYIQVESAFFWKWWQHQEEAFKREVVELVNNGQLEIVNGAWSMNDEAASHYQSIIDQFTWGFRFLNDSLGECGRPKVGWQIDPFGHSREHASILTQLGFQGLVIGRLDYRDKNKRKAEKNLDFIWHSSANLNNSEIFTTMFPDFYVSVKGYCFDVLCSDEQIIDDEKSPDYNLKKKVNGFANIMDEYRKYYQTPNILIPMGGDFNYQAAEINFSNLDKLIKGFEGHPTYNVFYSTPSCYIKAVNEEINAKSLKLQKKTDDFFPYANEKHGYWTGYFTSRPASKRFERVGNNILQAVKQLTAFSKYKGKDYEQYITSLREVMGIMQHHDAITGTEKEAVAKDYSRLLTQAIKEAEVPVGVIIGDLLKKDPQAEMDLKLSTCLLANISICDVSKKDRFIVAVYNPLSRPINHYVRIPVDEENYKIIGPDGLENYDVFEGHSAFEYVQEKIKPSKQELIFLAKQLPPLGVKLYYIEKEDTEKTKNSISFEEIVEDDLYGTETNGFTIDPETGLLNSVTIRGFTLNMTQNFLYYDGSTGSGGRASGAYVFRPKEQEAKPITKTKIQVKAKKGKLIDEVRQVFSSEVSQIIRAYKNEEEYIEFDWLVGNLQTDSSMGKEVITRFTVDDFSNKGIFYTDSNGRQQIRRELNKRSDYEYNASEEPVSSNYYPVTSKIVIKDDERNLEVAVLNDRAQGGSSLKDGVIELMVNRRLVRDDGFGVGESLRETEYGRGLYARGQHYLVFGSAEPNIENGKSTAAIERDLARRKLLTPWVLMSGNVTSLEETQNVVSFQFEGLTRALPENIHILTLEPWKDDTYLLRLEHTLEKNEDAHLSKPIVVDLENLFTLFYIAEIGETTLGANQWLDDYEEEEKLIWDDNNLPKPWTKLNQKDPLKIELHPMQIRTFIIRVEHK